MSEYQERGKRPTTPKQDSPKQNHSLQKKGNSNGDNPPSKVISFTPEETSLSQAFARLGKNPPDDGFGEVRQLMKNYRDPFIQRVEDARKKEEGLQMKKEGRQAPTTEDPVKADPTQEKQTQESTLKSVDPQTANLPLTDSVGRGGVNRLIDVIQVQNLLVGLGLLADIDILKVSAAEVTEATLATTIAAITKFQREVLHWNKVDGNIGGAESTTLKKLKTVDADYVIEKMAAYPAIAAKRKEKAAAKAEKEKQESLAKAQAEKAKKIETARIKKLKEEPATPENAQAFISSCSDTATLAKKLKEYASYNPELVIAALEETGYMSQDDLAFNIVSQTNNLSGLSQPLLQRLRLELDAGWTGEAEYEQIARIDKVLKKEIPKNTPVKSLEELMKKDRLSAEEIGEARKQINELKLEKQTEYFIKLQTKVKYVNQRTSQALEVESDYTSNEKKRSSEGDVIYADHSGGGMCNLSSLSMALRYLGVSKPSTKVKKDRYEDALEQLRVELISDGKLSFNDKFLKGSEQLRVSFILWRALAEHLGVKSKIVWVGNKKRKWYEENIGNSLRKGVGAIMSFKGHIVRLESITESGFVVDDPYGKVDIIKRNKNGKGGWKETNIRRSQTNGKKENAGENNIWTWEDIEKVNIKAIIIFER